MRPSNQEIKFQAIVETFMSSCENKILKNIFQKNIIRSTFKVENSIYKKV